MSSKDESSNMWAEDEYHFAGQRAKEHVLMVRNQHPYVLVPRFLIAILVFLLLFWLFHFIPWPYSVYFRIGLFGVLIFYLSYYIYGYRNTMNILSDERIVNVQQRGFFNTKITEAELNRIQDVSTDVKGVTQTMFGFGDVTIRTASESLLTLKNVGDPYEVQQAIVRALKDV